MKEQGKRKGPFFPLKHKGAYGTRIWAKTGENKPVWMYNILWPDVISEVTEEYVAAGAQIVQANTFGANRISVEKSSDYSVEEVVKAAVRIVRETVQGTSARVGLSAGPLTMMMEPYGDLEEDEVAEIYDEVFRAGIEEGADLIQLETFIDLNMLCVAAGEAKKYGVPVLSYLGGCCGTDPSYIALLKERYTD